jgi:hypothetical protein
MFIPVVYVCVASDFCRWLTVTPRPLETREQCEELERWLPPHRLWS